MDQYDKEQKIEAIDPKKIISMVGVSLFIFAIAIVGSGSVIGYLTDRFYPKILKTDWFLWAANAAAIVGIGFPIYCLLMRKIPNSERGEVVKLKPSRFIVLFFICTAAMYITSISSSIITAAIAYLKGDTQLINPAAEAVMNSNYVISLIYAAIIAPVTEEIIFRKILLDKLRRFGEIPAILMTGIAFGLFHMNLPQFFYAAVLGFIFAYITLRTNTVKYAIMLHMMVNLISTAMTPIVTSKNIIGSLLIVLWVLCAVFIGVILFILNMKNIKFEKAVPLVKKSDYILNTGTILYIFACFVVIVYQTIAY